MVSKLYSAREIVSALLRAGCWYVGQKGSHIKLRRRIGKRILTIIVTDDREVAMGTFRSILEQAEMSIDEFRQFLK